VGVSLCRADGMALYRAESMVLVPPPPLSSRRRRPLRCPS
jgi:hypothetical protein